jgi:MoaA/NifB/PqqE/SkfB family radical SAM enzyme
MRNIIKVAEKVKIPHIFARKIPLVVFFSITDRCNLKCKYCEIWKRKENELSTSQVFKIIDDLSRLGTFRISFCGGEPLLREDIGEIINYAKKKGLNVGMGSNGWYVKKRIDEIKNLDTIQFGLDGPKEVHDFQRGEGSFNMLMKAIKTCVNYGIKTFATMVITKNNLDYVDYVIDLAERMRFYILFQPVMPRPLTGKYTSSLQPEKKKYREVIKKLIKKKFSCKYIGNSLTILKYYYHWPKLQKIKCWAGRMHAAIDTNGNVFSCLDTRGKEKPLNCAKVGFEEAFKKIEKYNCKGCWTYGHNELNFLFSLNPNVVINSIRLI